MSAVTTGVRLALRSIMPVGAATLAQCLVSATVLAAAASDVSSTRELEQVVVTAPRMTAPLLVVTDPKQPRQPLPAHDGADYLKAIPGFSVIRKGGTDGDPVFRGMAASLQGFVQFTLAGFVAGTVAPFLAHSVRALALGMLAIHVGPDPAATVEAIERLLD